MAKRNDTPPEKINWRRQAHEIADSLAIAFILAMVIRHFVLEVFKIPTKSMQPTLQGDPSTGDKILVNKFAYDFADPERWDVMVFKYPEDTSRNYIKRVVGLPGETIRIHAGDLYIQTDLGRNHWEIARKPWKVQEALWRRRLSDSKDGSYWRPVNGNAWKISGHEFEVDAEGSDEGEYLEFDRQIYAYEAREFRESRGSFTAYYTGDIMVQFRLIPQGPAEVVVRLVNTIPLGQQDAQTEWRVYLPISDAEETPRLFRKKEQVKIENPGVYRLRKGKASLIQVCNVDQAIIVRVDGRQVIHYPFRRKGHFYDSLPPPVLNADVWIGCRNGRALFRDPAVFADVYYTNVPNAYAVREPLTLKEDQFFVLGDNSANSNDGRKWGVVPRRYLVGEAFLVLWPLGRMKLIR